MRDEDQYQLLRADPNWQRVLSSSEDYEPRYCVPIATDRELWWRHQHWWKTREKVSVYLEAGVLGHKLWERFKNCGAMATVEWSQEAQRHRVSAVLCKSRHCEPCMRQKAGRIAGNLKEKMKACPPGSFRFITLTLRHDNATELKAQLTRLIKHFRTLRSKPVWKKSQVGGAFTIEVKWSESGWHAHLHVIAQGKWMCRDKLRDEWNAITGDSFQADIRRIPSADALAGYVVKYVTKSTSPAVWDNAAIAKEYLLAVKGLRTCSTLGSWRGLALTKPRQTITDWKHIATLHDVVEQANNKQHWATAIVLSLRPPHEKTDDKDHRHSKKGQE